MLYHALPYVIWRYNTLNVGSQPAGSVPMRHRKIVVPRVPDEANAFREELLRVLASSHFQGSRRYPAFLSYVVEQALQGDPALKERTIGVEVFDRPTTYDTSKDAIVRVTAAEVRKRLAQYYHELEQPGELEIGLPSGSYAPEFRKRFRISTSRSSRKSLKSIPGGLDNQVEVDTPGRPLANSRKFSWKLSYSLAIAICVLIAVVVWSSREHVAGKYAAERRFWAPLLDSNSAAILCVGDKAGFSEVPGAPALPTATLLNNSISAEIVDRDHLSAPEVAIAMKVGALLESQGKHFRMTHSSVADYSDLRQGPAVLIGGFDNVWTMRAIRNLRFFMQMDGSMGGMIVDRQNPARTEWKRPFSNLQASTSRDYGIIARIKNSITGPPIIIAGGLTGESTVAATEFISTPEYLSSLLKDAPKNWEDMSMEAVVQTDLINGQPGTLRVVAVHYW